MGRPFRYVMYGVFAAIAVSTVVFYVNADLQYGKIVDMPNVGDDVQYGLDARTEAGVSDSVSESSLYVENPDGTKHYSISAKDSPNISD